MHITVTVTAKLEPDTGEQGAPVAEQTFYRAELDPALWPATIEDLGQAALADVSRMIGPLVVP